MRRDLDRPPELSVVIPVHNDERALMRILEQLDGREFEIIVVDGQSTDASLAVARQYGAITLRCAPGRGRQLNLGFAQATGAWIWLLHADSEVCDAMLDFLETLPCQPGWGRFDVRLEGSSPLLRAVGFLMNLRSRVTGICTGDQGIYVHRELIDEIGGIPQQPLMEDIELSKRLKRHSPPDCPRLKLITSARRWESRGVLPTVLTMWGYRLAYWFGADPERLARRYYS